jgi:16S rRNA (cytosine967-C5)-methyltransferase
MSRYHSYINSAIKILQAYDGKVPFSIFIKQIFSKEKKYGSKDRKQITTLCYNWFRVGSLFQKKLNEENLLRSIFLVTNEPSAFLNALKPEWNSAVEKKAEEKMQLLEHSFTAADIFPFSAELNEQTKTEEFYTSFLQQPHLFVRIRPQYKKIVLEKINTSAIPHSFLNNENTIELAPGYNIENIATADKEVVIQDYSSQQVLNFLNNSNFLSQTTKVKAWDCCAASGGKSILLYDILKGNVTLTVSDIRQSILANLQYRFKNAGITHYHHFIADITKTEDKLPADKYDLIICDAPCSGSGTWGRTPEQLYYFNRASIDEFAERQRKIVTNVLPYLKKDGLFFYITCSVFKKENEDVAEYIGQQNGMLLADIKNIFGYVMNADSMFVAVFKKVT